jgi:anti-sigma B factor antagonist
MELAQLAGQAFDSCFVVRVDGEIDASNASEMTDRISGMVEGGASGLVVDLSGIRYLDSAGIRMLFELHARLDSLGRRLAIASPADSPSRQVLDIVEVSQVIPLADSADGAVRLIDPKGPPGGA